MLRHIESCLLIFEMITLREPRLPVFKHHQWAQNLVSVGTQDVYITEHGNDCLIFYYKWSEFSVTTLGKHFLSFFFLNIS